MSEFALYPEERHWWSFNDYRTVLNVTRRLAPARVLEFGPGSSTLALMEGGAGYIDACEDDPRWMESHRRLEAATVKLRSYVWSDPLSIPALDDQRYDLGLIDGPRETVNRVAVLDYCLQRCTAVLMPLEGESAERHGLGYLRPFVMARGRHVELIESGPLAGTFALLTA